MKKLMIAAAIVCAAVVSQAAQFSWSTSTGQYLYKAGTSTKLDASYTAYIFSTADITQDKLLDNILNKHKSIASQGALASKAVTSSATLSAATEQFDWGTPNVSTLNAYIAIVDGDNVFISDVKSQTTPDSGTKPLQYATTTKSKAAAVTFTGTQTAAGWYTVPEPTSGLLLLLGVAGLALKRRRA